MKRHSLRSARLGDIRCVVYDDGVSEVAAYWRLEAGRWRKALPIVVPDPVIVRFRELTQSPWLHCFGEIHFQRTKAYPGKETTADAQEPCRLP
jgi:hypothetical protein